jgi:hypothetical protein
MKMCMEKICEQTYEQNVHKYFYIIQNEIIYHKKINKYAYEYNIFLRLEVTVHMYTKKCISHKITNLFFFYSNSVCRSSCLLFISVENNFMCLNVEFCLGRC